MSGLCAGVPSSQKRGAFARGSAGLLDGERVAEAMSSESWDIVAWLALIAGVTTLVVGFKARSKAKRQVDWVSVPGTVTSSEVKYDGELYVPAVTYRYEVAGQQLIGNTVKSGLVSYNWRGPAKRICERYAVNAEVRVHVDARDPSHAVLEPGGDTAYLPLVCAVSALFLAIGILLLAS